MPQNETEVRCKWCGVNTTFTGTRECNAHWELRHRIEKEPEMARRMLTEVEKSSP